VRAYRFFLCALFYLIPTYFKGHVNKSHGQCFARYTDDRNVYVRSRKAGERVMVLLRKCYAKLRLKANEAKSAVVSVQGRKFLGYSF
jgi:RNA-directed DNA polymerase